MDGGDSLKDLCKLVESGHISVTELLDQFRSLNLEQTKRLQIKEETKRLQIKEAEETKRLKEAEETKRLKEVEETKRTMLSTRASPSEGILSFQLTF